MITSTQILIDLLIGMTVGFLDSWSEKVLFVFIVLISIAAVVSSLLYITESEPFTWWFLLDLIFMIIGNATGKRMYKVFTKKR